MLGLITEYLSTPLVNDIDDEILAAFIRMDKEEYYEDYLEYIEDYQ